MSKLKAFFSLLFHDDSGAKEDEGVEIGPNSNSPVVRVLEPKLSPPVEVLGSSSRSPAATGVLEGNSRLPTTVPESEPQSSTAAVDPKF